jgi:hypothetical protein
MYALRARASAANNRGVYRDPDFTATVGMAEGILNTPYSDGEWSKISFSYLARMYFTLRGIVPPR